MSGGGNEAVAANPRLMKRKVLIRKTDPDEPVEERHAPALERQLLKTSVLSMAAHRRSCSGCGRCPLIGERIQVFAVRDGRERALCDLCAAGAGEPVRMERVWPVSRTLAVQRAA
jgi:hypothetical protein